MDTRPLSPDPFRCDQVSEKDCLNMFLAFDESRLPLTGGPPGP